MSPTFITNWMVMRKRSVSLDRYAEYILGEIDRPDGRLHPVTTSAVVSVERWAGVNLRVTTRTGSTYVLLGPPTHGEPPAGFVALEVHQRWDL